MIVIRLSRGGSKKSPFYRLTVADKRNARDGRYIERVGTYNPLASGQEEALILDMPKIEKWIGNGAQPSPRVKSLIKQHKKAAAAA